MIYESVITNDYARQAVALEANFISNAVASVRDFFPKMLTSINRGFAKLDDVKLFVPSANDGTKISFTRNEKKILELLPSVPYDELAVLRLAVPEGFQGNYNTYFSVLAQSFAYHQSIALPAIEKYYIELASIITNRNAKLSLKDRTDQTKSLTSSREKLNDDLSSFFLTRSTQAEQPFGKLFTNEHEVKQLFRQRYELQDLLKNTKLNLVTGHVENIKSSLDVLIKMAEEGKIEELSPAQLRNLTEGAYEVASQVEFFAINYFRTITAVNTITPLQVNLLNRLSV